ncbi:MAG: hypothetical protein HQL16_05040 [Candidatus Omnitrophica bacterium]|nr:hypothetical protein [Candidatus Omnitrophota bacterium]
MLSDKIRILNFDDTVATQKALVTRYHPVISDLRALGPGVRLWSNAANARKVSAAFAPEFKNAVTFLGSGDFHHISSLLMDQFEEPVTLIVFDHHPDWDVLPPRLGCGSWVSRTLKRPNVKKVVLLGVSSNDISSYSIQTGNLKALASSRVEIYPYQHRATSTFLKKVPADNVSVKVRNKFLRSRIEWQELQGRNLEQFFGELLKRLPTKKVYVSLDKDCLGAYWSRTNWEEGFFKFPEVLLLLKLIRKNLDIAGMDITGDYSPARMDGAVKTVLARLDHPRDYTAREQTFAEVQAVNEKLNIQILESLSL